MGEKQNIAGCSSVSARKSCCRIESVVSIDARGQIVLPKGIREKANIGAGDKLAIVSWEKDGKVCCISLIKAEDFAGMLKDILEPVISDVLEKE